MSLMTSSSMMQNQASLMRKPAAPVRMSQRASRMSVRAVAAPSETQAKVAQLLQNNRRWAQAQVKYDMKFFDRLKNQQSPEYLWIGCADSRVPANTIVGLDPGEVFVQRNVGNQARHTDMNCQSCIEFAVKALKVKAIIVCGHSKCGAVKAALRLPSKTPGLVNCWIADIREARNQHKEDLKGLSEEEQVQKLCEFNVLRQVFHVCTSPTVQEAWANGQELTVHGLCYSLEDGLLQSLVGPITSNADVGETSADAFLNRVQQQQPKKEPSPWAIFGGSDPEPAPVVVEKPLIQVNNELLAEKLQAHVAWDKGFA